MRAKPLDALGRRKKGSRNPYNDKSIEETERDLWILLILAEFRYCRTHFIFELIPPEIRGTWYSFQKRIGRLFDRKNTRHGGSYINWPQHQKQPGGAHLSVPAIWELTPAGYAALNESIDNVQRFYGRHMIGANRQLIHSMMAWDTIASLKIGVQNHPSAEWVGWSDILKRASKQTQESKQPFAFPVDTSHTFPSGKTEPLKYTIVPDSTPLGFRYSTGAHRFCVIEAENENQVDASNFKVSSFLKKFLAYRDIAKKGTIHRQLGLQKFYVLVVTGSDLHKRNMMRLIERETNGAGSELFLFKTIPLLGGKIRPMPEMWSTPWKRAGKPDFYLCTPSGEAPNLT